MGNSTKIKMYNILKKNLKKVLTTYKIRGILSL